MPKSKLNIIAILILSSLFSTLCLADELILKDSTEIEESYIQSNSVATNFGRVQQGGETRVVIAQGPIYSNARKIAFRATNLDDSLDARSVTGLVDSAYIDWYIQAISNTGDSSGVYWVVRLSPLEPEKDWLEGNENAATAIDAVTWDSCVHIGAGSGPGIAWATAGAAGTADTVGYATGMTMDSVKITMDSTAGDRIRFYLDPQQIDDMRTAGANNGWLIATTSKSGNIAAAIQLYGSETSVTGRADSIPALHLFYTAAAGSSSKKLGAAKLGAGKW